ncbi:2Fe-2S iron-sulfur cluster-binding protein [Altererythrobacter sp. C41]|uniref:2Fe-2S iron-sulfur cluster-binding protein n=1 Tax=Altererythrobacter sp. C41 TaxID=2806021 RepID=UPI0019346E48|nr:2Fe-2S iron-sulfur cluster-binding protein [Altererythrobacter sp. C41]MBM0171275.1 (2Fe-2S)-binding protein [Altererythrobacter sp. C41]
MVRIRFEAAEGTYEVHAEANHTLLDAALAAGIAEIEGQCGGFLNCATCHVYVAEPWAEKVGPANEDEEELLEGTLEPRRATSRLSCQITLHEGLDGLTVRLPRRQS